MKLQAMMAQHGLQHRRFAECGGTNPIDLICHLRKRKRGDISYGELGRRMKMSITGDLSMSDMGLAVPR
jgi:hypothetical protein